MEKQLTLKLEEYTKQIKEKEKQIVLNFVDIGKQLKEVRDKQIYKEKFNNWEDYIKDNFSFSKRNADNMIRVFEVFGKTSSQIGFWKCLELAKLPEEQRQELMQENNVEDMSVREVSEVVEDKKAELGIEEQQQDLTQTQEESPKVADKVDMLDKALSYLSEELDNVFSGLDNLQKPIYKKEYSENKQYFRSTFKSIDGKLLEVTNKLRKAKALIKRLKQFRR